MLVINDLFFFKSVESFKNSKLPSFFITINVVSFEKIQSIKNKLAVFNNVGEFCYYSTQNNGEYWFSMDDSLISLNNHYSDACVYVIDDDKSKIEREVSYLLMHTYMYRLVNTGNMMIHAAAVVYRQQSVLFCGLSGAGKSTQANLWKEYLHAHILNYDKPCIIEENGQYYAHGSPWSGKEALYLNECYQLKAIVFVVQDTNIKVDKLSVAKAYSLIFLHNYLYPINEEIEKKYSNVVSRIVQKIPVYELHCDISENSVCELFDVLFPDKNYKKVREELPMKYKVKDCFTMNRILDEYIVIPRGKSAVDFSATVVFNETGAFLWDKLADYKTVDELALFLCEKYSIDNKTAVEDSKAFIDKLDSNGLLDKV